MPPIEFTQNYQDLSTDVGFQFKFPEASLGARIGRFQADMRQSGLTNTSFAGRPSRNRWFKAAF